MYGNLHVKAAESLKERLSVGKYYCVCTHCGEEVSKRRYFTRPKRISRYVVARERVEARRYAVRHHLIDVSWSPGVLVCNTCHLGEVHRSESYFHHPSHWIYCKIFRVRRNTLWVIIASLLRQERWLRELSSGGNNDDWA